MLQAEPERPLLLSCFQLSSSPVKCHLLSEGPYSSIFGSNRMFYVSTQSQAMVTLTSMNRVARVVEYKFVFDWSLCMRDDEAQDEVLYWG